MKLYPRLDAEWFHDLEDVYFLDDLLFAAQPLVYWHDGPHWRELHSLPRKPTRLILRSSPSGAAVFLDGRKAGATPLIKAGWVAPYVLLRMEAPGHYVREEPVNLAAGSEVLLDWRLQPLLPADALPQGDSLPLDDFMRPDAPNLEAYEAREAKVLARISGLQASRERSLARFDSLYPPLKPREEFEKTTDFEARRTAYGQERSGQETRLTLALDQSLAAHRSALDSIARHKRPLEKEQLRQGLVNPTLELQRYNPDKEKYPFRLSALQPTLRFAYDGVFSLPPESAKKVKASPESLSCEVRYWNLRAPRDSGAPVFLAMDSLSCAFSGRPLRIENGSFTYPGELTAGDGYARIRDLQAEFEREREESWRKRLEEEQLRAAMARKAKWKKVRRNSGIAAAAAALAGGIFAYYEKRQAESLYGEYRNAISPQAALQAKQGVENHDRKALLLGIGSALTLGVSIPLFFF